MWLESIYQHADENIAKVLVGNKIDREEDRKISEHDARQMAKQNNMQYYEASAKQNLNIETFMTDIMTQIYHIRFSSFTTDRLPTFKLRQSDVVNRESTLKGKSGKNCGKCW